MTRVLLLVSLLLGPAIAGAQTSDEFFDSRTLHDVRLYIHSVDLRQLRERYLEDIYVPADFEWRGIRVRNVGVRVRGLGHAGPGLLHVQERRVAGIRAEQQHGIGRSPRAD